MSRMMVTMSPIMLSALPPGRHAPGSAGADGHDDERAGEIGDRRDRCRPRRSGSSGSRTSFTAWVSSATPIAIARLLFLKSETLWLISAGSALRTACGIIT